MGKLQQLLPWPLPPPSALLHYSSTVMTFNPSFPLLEEGNAMENPSQRWDGFAVQLREVLVGLE